MLSLLIWPKVIQYSGGHFTNTQDSTILLNVGDIDCLNPRHHLFVFAKFDI